MVNSITIKVDHTLSQGRTDCGASLEDGLLGERQQALSQIIEHIKHHLVQRVAIA